MAYDKDIDAEPGRGPVRLAEGRVRLVEQDGKWRLPRCGEEATESIDLRRATTLLGEEEARMVVREAELQNFRNVNRYCGVCGAVMEAASAISVRCTACGREVWPAVAPAVLVLVLRDDKALLVHAKTFSRPFYGLVAGFVETAESLEECVRREVREETTLEITNVRYFGSQPWPFPSQLMIGFVADYVSGEVLFADGELSSGAFFGRDELPLLPLPGSLALTMIEAWRQGKMDS